MRGSNASDAERHHFYDLLSQTSRLVNEWPLATLRLMA